MIKVFLKKKLYKSTKDKMSFLSFTGLWQTLHVLMLLFDFTFNVR